MFYSNMNSSQDLYEAFLKHANIFAEVTNFMQGNDTPKLFSGLMSWLKEVVAINKAHPELRSEINILCNMITRCWSWPRRKQTNCMW